MNQPLVYVLVINWNGREHLDGCFESLLASSYSNALFLLVDNGSDDDSVALVETQYSQDPRVGILCCDENRGWSGGNNTGIEHALAHGADYVFLLNNDTAIAPDCLERLVAAMEGAPDCGALAPRMLLFDQPSLLNSIGLEMSIIGAAWDRGIGRADGPAWHEPVSVVGACGGAAFIRCAVLEQTGLLPEEFEIYLDDLDLCLRIWSAGYTIRTCPQAVVRHKFSATMGLGRWAHHKYYLNTRNRFWLLMRHVPRARLIRIAPWLALGELRALGRAMLSGSYWRIACHVRAWLAALAYAPRARRFQRTAQGPHPDETFWPLVCRRPLFCPALVLPDKGWYPPETFQGERLRPMGPVATLKIPEGPLRVSLVNCYPDFGPATITLLLDGDCLGTLRSSGREEATYATGPGELTLQTTFIFPPSATGRPVDIGGWLQIHSAGNPLI